LQKTAQIAAMTLAPSKNLIRRRWLQVVEESNGKYVAINEEPPLLEIPLGKKDVETWVLHWTKAAKELAAAMTFSFLHPKTEGLTRQIGTLHPPKKSVTGVYLHLPASGAGRRVGLLAEMALLPPESTLLLPSSSLVNDEVMAVAQARALRLDFIAERLEAEEPGSMQIRARSAASATNGAKKGAKIEPLLDLPPGATWEKLHLEIDPAGRLLARYGRQRKSTRLPKASARKVSRSTEILLTVAIKEFWQNPPVRIQERDATARAFNRLERLLMSLFPIWGHPFERREMKFIPRFRIQLTREAQEAVARENQKEEVDWEDREF
jgi:hypothetical protein